jgi:hypothetical protein
MITAITLSFLFSLIALISIARKQHINNNKDQFHF